MSGPSAPPPPRLPRHDRRRFVLLLAALALVALSVGGGALFLWHPAQTPAPPVSIAKDTATATAPTVTVGPGTPTALPPTATATIVAPSYATAATVTFTRRTGTVSSPNTLTAATSGGNIPAIQQPQVAVALGEAPATETDAPFTPGQNTTFQVTVTNTDHVNSRISGGVIHDTTGKWFCGLVGSPPPSIGPGASTTQMCSTNPKAYPALTWNDTDSNAPLTYTASTGPMGADPFWTVPSTCAADHKADADAKTSAALQGKLDAQLSGGSNRIFQSVTPSGSAVCSPTGGTQMTSGNSYTVSDAGTGQQTTYKPADAQAFQAGRVTPDGGYALTGSASACQGLAVSNASASGATITCVVTQGEAFVWTTALLQTLAGKIAGLSLAAAQSLIQAQSGLVASSLRITLTGGALLPRQVNAITFTVN